jgi:hypothetical protein
VTPRWRAGGEATTHRLPIVRACLAGVIGVGFCAGAVAQQIVCEFSYGGETKAVVAQPVASPYVVPELSVSDTFTLRVVFRNEPAELASVKIYIYARGRTGPQILHQATYPYPVPDGERPGFGFTGRQFVYEPVLGRELQYWCRLRAGDAAAR